jgi:glycosyltransferase involved in cell wall biosynthesis
VSGAPLKVVIGFPFGTSLGGSERLLGALLRDHERTGLAPHLVTFADGPFIDEIRALGVPVTVIDPGRFRSPWRLIGAIRAARRLLREERPDLVVSWLPRVQTVLAPAAALAGMAGRVVYFEHERARPRDGLARAALALPCAHVIANSQASLDAVGRLWPHRRGTVVWPGVDEPERPAETELEALRARLGLPEDRPVVAIVGRLLGWKGQDRAIEAIRLLRERGRDVSLLVVGGEAHGVEAGIEARLRSQVRDGGLEDRVVFCGQVDDATPYVALADVLLSASSGEPFGMVLVEAMALGVPVVAAASGGPVEIIEHGTSGMLARTEEPGDLAEALERVLGDAATAAALGRAGQERYAELFTSARWVRETADALRAVAAPSAPVDP